MEPMDFPELVDFAELVNFSELTKLMAKDQTPGKVWTHRKRPNLWEKGIPATWPIPIDRLSMTSMVWNISVGQPGLAVWLCSLLALVYLLISQTLKTEKSPWFLINN